MHIIVPRALEWDGLSIFQLNQGSRFESKLGNAAALKTLEGEHATF